MKPRQKPYGDKNICGANIERIRRGQKMKQTELASRMQVLGVDINLSSLSKIEGQQRILTDKELRAIAVVLNVDINDLFS